MEKETMVKILEGLKKSYIGKAEELKHTAHTDLRYQAYGIARCCEIVIDMINEPGYFETMKKRFSDDD